MRSAVAALAVASSLAAGCAAGGRGGDGGVRDLGAHEMAAATAGLVAPGRFVDLVLAPAGTALATDAQGNLWAAQLSGVVAPQMIATHVSATVRVNDAVFVWHDAQAGGAALAAFVGGALRELATGAPTAGELASYVASDGSHVAFLANQAAGRADLIAQKSDGSATFTLTSGLDIAGGCAPSLQLIAGALVVSRCVVGGFAIVAYAPDNGAITPLLSPAAAGFVSVPSRAAVVTLNPMNGSSLVPVAGGAATPLSGNVKRSLAVADGSAVVQVTIGGGVVRARLPDGGLTSLVATGAGDLEAVSGDGAWVLYSGPADAATGNATLYLAPGKSAGTPTSINAAATTPPLVGGGFSDDSSWVAYFTDVGSDGRGPLRARPLVGGVGASRTLSEASSGFLTAGAARLVYGDRYAPGDAGLPHADVQLVDLATSAPPALLARHAALPFRLTDDGKTLAFIADDGTTPGLYATALP